MSASYHSLAVRDLQRGQGVGLPSGEAVARHMGIAPLTAEQVGISSTGWRGETPLWYYILREADACTGGHRLGPVGGGIVTEALVGLVDADATSFRQNSSSLAASKKHLLNCSPPSVEETSLRISGVTT